MNAENDVTHGQFSLRHPDGIGASNRIYEREDGCAEKCSGEDVGEVVIAIIYGSDGHEEHGKGEPLCEARFPSCCREQRNDRGHDVAARESVSVNPSMALNKLDEPVKLTCESSCE